MDGYQRVGEDNRRMCVCCWAALFSDWDWCEPEERSEPFHNLADLNSLF